MGQESEAGPNQNRAIAPVREWNSRTGTAKISALLLRGREIALPGSNLVAAIVAEKDPAKQAALRKQATFSDFYLGSVHALAQTGELVIASASGSQLTHVVFTSPNLIFVVGTQKITPTLADARERVAQYVFPLEDQRMKSTGAPGSVFSKELILHREPTMMGRKVRMILVKEKLGF